MSAATTCSSTIGHRRSRPRPRPRWLWRRQRRRLRLHYSPPRHTTTTCRQLPQQQHQQQQQQQQRIIIIIISQKPRRASRAPRRSSKAFTYIAHSSSPRPLTVPRQMPQPATTAAVVLCNRCQMPCWCSTTTWLSSTWLRTRSLKVNIRHFLLLLLFFS